MDAGVAPQVTDHFKAVGAQAVLASAAPLAG